MDKETIMQLLADGVISNEVATKYFPELKESRDEYHASKLNKPYEQFRLNALENIWMD